MVFKLIRFFSILLSNVNLQEQYTELPTKDETSETTVWNLFSPFSCIQVSFVGQNWFISVLKHFVNHQNTQLNAETKNQALNRHIF